MPHPLSRADTYRTSSKRMPDALSLGTTPAPRRFLGFGVRFSAVQKSARYPQSDHCLPYKPTSYRLGIIAELPPNLGLSNHRASRGVCSISEPLREGVEKAATPL